MQLTQVKALIGSAGQRRILLAQLRRDAAGAIVAEDASGSVPLALDAADASPVAGYLAEGLFLLLEGELKESGVFEVITIADPPLEGRAAAAASLQGLQLSGATSLRCACCLPRSAPSPPPQQLSLAGV